MLNRDANIDVAEHPGIGSWLTTVSATRLDRVILALCKILQNIYIDKLHPIALGQLDQSHALELGEGTAHGFDGQAEEITDIGARHRQLDIRRILPITPVTAGEGQQKSFDALHRAALAGDEHKIARGSQLSEGLCETTVSGASHRPRCIPS